MIWCENTNLEVIYRREFKWAHRDKSQLLKVREGFCNGTRNAKGESNRDFAI